MRWLIPASVLLAFVLVSPAAAVVTCNPTLRTVTSPRFFVDWSNSSSNIGDPEEINTINWRGGSNLTNAFFGGGSDVEYFANSWAPPEIGVVLVGAGTVGTGPGWTCVPGNSVQVTSVGPTGVTVDTKYQFFDTTGPAGDKIKVKRDFTFASAFLHDFRPYMPRLHPRTNFTQVLHPNASYTSLEIEAVSACEFGGSFGAPGCVLDTTTSPHSWNGNSLSNDNWFAIHDPTSGTGVIVKRDPTPSISVALWIDQDFGSFTNVSSVLLRQPSGGFTGTVTEVEFLCFYDSSTWSTAMQIALILPSGC